MPFFAAGSVGAGLMAAGAGAVASTAVGAGINALTTSSQSGTIAKGAEQANAISQQTIDEGRGNYVADRAVVQPFVDQGTGAFTRANALLGLAGPEAAATAMDGFTTSPGYQFRLKEGLSAVDNAAAARGMLRSGATLKAEQAFGEGLAGAEFGNYFNRLNDLAKSGLGGASLQLGATGNYNNLLTGQSSGQQQTLVGEAGTQAGLTGKLGDGISSQVGTLVKNGLYEYGKGSFGGGSNGLTVGGFGSTGGSVFDGAGVNI